MHRLKLASGGYFGKLIKFMSQMDIFTSISEDEQSSTVNKEKMQKQRLRTSQIRIIDKLSWLIALISFY